MKDIKWWKKIQSQFMIFILMLLVVLLLFCIKLFREAEQSIEDNSIAYVQSYQDAFIRSTEQLYAQVETICLQLQYDDDCKEFMKCTSYDQVTYSLTEQIKNVVASKMIINNAIIDIAFYSDLLRFSAYMLPSEMVMLADAVPDTHEVVPLGMYKADNSYKDANIWIYGYNYYVGRGQKGVIFISVDLSKMAAMPNELEQGGNLLLCDATNTSYYLGDKNKREFMPDDVEELLAKVKEEEKNEIFSYGQYIVSAKKVDSINGTILGIIDTQQIRTQLTPVFDRNLVLVVILSISCILFNLFFYRSVVRPLSRLNSYIEDLEKERSQFFRYVAPVKTGGCLEIQTIGSEFYRLLLAIQKLSNEILIKEKEVHQKELAYKNAEIEALRSQINPHFLYNTLELIRAVAIDGKVNDISKITSAMGKMYRYAIEGDATVALRKEIEAVKSYIYIQNLRYDGRVVVFYNISQDTYKVPVPKMILQPIVENAFQHGFAQQSGESTLYIGAIKMESELILSVRDDGIGMEADELEKMQKVVDQENIVKDKIGLANVAGRIKLLYGQEAKLSIYSKKGEGTIISLKIPL